MKKKVILIANVMLCAALLCACGKAGENQKDSNEKWEDNDSCIGYIGIHDFDDDSVPELIIGDDVSVGIYPGRRFGF